MKIIRDTFERQMDFGVNENEIPFQRMIERNDDGSVSRICLSVKHERKRHIYHVTIEAEEIREILESEQVFHGEQSTKAPEEEQEDEQGEDLRGIDEDEDEEGGEEYSGVEAPF